MQILTRKGFKDFDGFIQSGESNKIVNLHLSNNEILNCTHEHGIRYNNEYIQSQNIKVNNILHNNIKVLNKTYSNEMVPVYDAINVKDIHSFIANGIDVHNCLICDELAFVDPPWKAEEFWKSNYPTISASNTSKIIIISTPNGMYNLFHRLYTGAEKGNNTFKHNKYDWRSVPTRTEKWAKQEMKNLGKLAFSQEYGCEFLGSSATVIDADILRNMQNVYKEPLLYDLEDNLRIYEKPIQNTTYVIGNDVAKGTGKHYSTCQILKIISTNPLKLEQVAVYQNNFVDVYNFSTIINKLCYYYNNAWLMVENNSDGAAVVNQLWWTYENENLVNSGSKSVDLGIRATTTTKPKAVLFMKKLIESGNLILTDQKTIMELNDFIDKGNNKYGANNYDDDLVSGLYWACYLFQLDLIDDIDFMKNENTNDEDDVWGILSDIDCDPADDFYVVM
jgi:hypothetical protein